MKILFPTSWQRKQGSALAMTMVMTGVALAILAGTLTWSSQSTRLTHRTVQYHRSVAAAEAATEKVLSKMASDYLIGGDKQVADNLALGIYQARVPTSSDSSYWSDWEFNDTATAGKTFVQVGVATNYVLANSAYAGLRAFATTYRVAAHARITGAREDVVGGVLQEIYLARIPVFQFAMYSSSDMEISCGKPFKITGRVHSNGTLYVEPDDVLTFQSDVTFVKELLFHRAPGDTRGTPAGTPAGSAVYQVPVGEPVSALILPIGTTNSPEAIRDIIQPPLTGESADSPIGRLRYYNLADMLIVVSDSGVTATSGKFNNFATPVPTNEVAAFVTLTNTFKDAREGKFVKPVDINIGLFTEWSRTNTSLRVALGQVPVTNAAAMTNTVASYDVSSIYVLDQRTLAATNLSAVRVSNGKVLPRRGLTVATARPLYVQGHYNQTNAANLATTNTTSTRPASLVGDAITVLSQNWADTNSAKSVGSRGALPTTVNAAFLTGVVETTAGKYSGGMENFPRFLETWDTANPFTYNGSMVKMFPSLYATNAWGKSDVYVPPKRDWAYDLNFNDPSKLPPLTPSLLTVIRGQWATLPPDKNYASVSP